MWVSGGLLETEINKTLFKTKTFLNTKTKTLHLKTKTSEFRQCNNHLVKDS